MKNISLSSTSAFSLFKDWEKATDFSDCSAESISAIFLGKQEELNREIKDHLYLSTKEIVQFPQSLQEKGNSNLKKISPNKRYNLVHNLLKSKCNENSSVLASIIEHLQPISGVREAVQNFLIKFILEQKKEFTDEFVRAMFKGSRFKEFFFQSCEDHRPLMEDLRFSLAILDGNISPELLWSSHCGYTTRIIDVEYPIVLQVVQEPILNNLQSMKSIAKWRFRRAGPSALTKADMQIAWQQLYAIIALGFYNKQGYRTSFKESLGRGATQFEQEIVSLHKKLDNLFQESDFLGQIPRLYRRLMAENWGFNESLIEMVRGVAIRVENLPNFFPIREEIHNFPTGLILEKTKHYAQNFQGDEKSRSLLKYLIYAMEKFLNISTTSESAKDSWEGITQLRQTISQEPETIENFLKDREYQIKIIQKGVEELQKLKGMNDGDYSFANLLDFSRRLIVQVALDDMLTQEVANRYLKELVKLEKASELELSIKIEILRSLLDSCINQVQGPLHSAFDNQDKIFACFASKENKPIRFVDTILRTYSISLVGQLVDYLNSYNLSAKSRIHTIGQHKVETAVEVFNPGNTEGILRINPDPMEMKSNEIGLFFKTPFETKAIQGILSLESVGRLSHLQLLVKGLGIPSVRVPENLMEYLKELEGKKISLSATEEALKIEEVNDEKKLTLSRSLKKISVPLPNYSIDRPLPFSEIVTCPEFISGSKGTNLARMYLTKMSVPNGLILPFGFFRKYAEGIGIQAHLEVLSQLELRYPYLISNLIEKIRLRIFENPISSEMLQDVMTALNDLSTETKVERVFVRSDTNIEDLSEFNGAGLHTTVPNVKVKSEEINLAIRRVWASILEEKSISWIAKALSSDHVIIACPSIVIMPTIEAVSSGVFLTKEKSNLRKEGVINANRGIAAVVDSSNGVEEIVLIGKKNYRLSFPTSEHIQMANSFGGLDRVEVKPGEPVLSKKQIAEIKQIGNVVEEVLGIQPNGYDIEWAYDKDQQLIVLQARANM